MTKNKHKNDGGITMKCNQCGTEFEGKFCPECGAKNEAEKPVTPPPIQEQAQQVYQQPISAEAKPKKKKKPFFLRWWFILIAIIVIGVIALSTGGGGEKIVWDDIILGDMLPEPPANKGEIHTNSADELWIDINDLSDKQLNDYIATCKEKGFTVDAESNSSSYDAYNTEGYKLSLGHYGSNADMSIKLETPMEMTTITWPTSAAGKQLPTPKSTMGKFSYEHDDNFFVYIGNTSKADYSEYVNTCSEKGFNVDYNKGDNYYYADNSEGWKVDIRYVGNNVMSIKINAPKSEDTDSTLNSSTESEETTKPVESSKPSESSSKPDNSNLVNGMHKDFKEAMDSYEKFMDEYVSFMKKYNANPTDMGLLSDYANYMSKYTDMVSKFDKWENEDLNDTELAYYLDVQTRVTKKLLEVTN